MDKKTSKQEIKEWIKSIIFSVIMTIPIILFASPAYVDGKSMESVLSNRDVLLSERVTAIKDNFKHGEIVIFDAKPIEDKNYIKRIIGLPKDIVEIKEGHVYLNGELLKEDYLKEGTCTLGEVNLKVPEGKLFVLGDNRGGSSDSRAFGCIDIEKVKSRAYYRIFPFNKMGKVK